MCKRFIAIPLLCLVVIMAACPFSVYAFDPSSPTFPYPVNGLSGDFNLTYSSRDATGDLISGSTSVVFGYLWKALFLTPDNPSYDDVHSMGYRVAIKASVVLNVTVGGDLYIAVPANVSYWTDVDNFNAYRYSDGDYRVDFNQTAVTTFTPDNDSGTFVRGDGTGDLDVSFMCYRAVPAGTYRIELDFYENSNTNPICFGIYADTRPSMTGYVDAYINSLDNVGSTGIPAVGLSTALQDLWELRQSNTGDSIELSILRELEYQSSVEYLLNQVDTKYVGYVASFYYSALSFYNELFSGNMSYDVFLAQTSLLASEASNFCSTVEQFQALSIIVQNLYTAAEQIERIKAKANLEQAISDGDVQEIQQYYDAEQELISAFDQAKFQAQLDFDTWFALLPSDQTIEYKKFYDYILNDSPIKNFIMIPVSLGLVTILLGTGIRFVGSKRGENSD